MSRLISGPPGATDLATEYVRRTYKILGPSEPSTVLGVNVSSAGKVDGKGLSHTSNNQGRGQGTLNDWREAGSYGGESPWSSGAYGSTFRPIDVGSGGWSTRGGAAVRLDADELVLDGDLDSTPFRYD